MLCPVHGAITNKAKPRRNTKTETGVLNSMAKIIGKSLVLPDDPIYFEGISVCSVNRSVPAERAKEAAQQHDEDGEEVTDPSLDRHGICHSACRSARNWMRFPTRFEYHGKEVQLDEDECEALNNALNGARKNLHQTMKGMERPAFELLDALSGRRGDFFVHFYEEHYILLIDVHFGGEEIRRGEHETPGLDDAMDALAACPECKHVRICYVDAATAESCCYDFSAAELRAVGDAHRTTGDQGESSSLEGDGRS